MASLVAPCPTLNPRGSSAAASSIFRALAPSCADRVCFDPSGVLMQADAARDGKRRRRHGGDGDSRQSKKQAVRRVLSPVAQLSCARIRPLVRASRPKAKEETHVVRGDVQVIKKQNAGEMKVPRAGVLRNDTHGRSKMKKEDGERVRATVTKRIPPPSRPASVMKVRSAGVLRNEARGVIKTKKEASRSVQATVTKSIPQIRPPAPAAKHQDPHTAQDALRAALAVARQALDRRQQNVYRQQREEARRELDKVVRTVFFDDPYITFEDALKP